MLMEGSVNQSPDQSPSSESGKPGRPSIYTKELADKICEKIAEGKSLRAIRAENDWMPDLSTIFAWMREKEGFSKQYELAKEQSALADDEELQQIGDEAIAESKIVDPKAAGAVVSAYKLKADNLKWFMSKKKPKKYGESSRLDVTTDGKPLPASILSNLNTTDGVLNNNSHQEGGKDAEAHPGNPGGNVSVENNLSTPILDRLGADGQNAENH